MSDKLRAAAQAVLDWLKDKRLDTWAYMEGSQFYSDRDKQVKALEAALEEPAIKESLTAQRPWVGLTVDDQNDCLVSADPCECLADSEAHQLMDDVEAKLREKNGG